MGNYLIFLASIVLSIAGQLLMKQGMNQMGAIPTSQILVKVIPMFLNPWVFSGLVAFGFSSIFWLVILSRMELSLVYPMVSVAYVIIALASLLLFKEGISLLRWVSIAVICFGVILISKS
jgi:multidrug transporter EmrE-like cation transporter